MKTNSEIVNKKIEEIQNTLKSIMKEYNIGMINLDSSSYDHSRFILMFKTPFIKASALLFDAYTTDKHTDKLMEYAMVESAKFFIEYCKNTIDKAFSKSFYEDVYKLYCGGEYIPSLYNKLVSCYPEYKEKMDEFLKPFIEIDRRKVIFERVYRYWSLASDLKNKITELSSNNTLYEYSDIQYSACSILDAIHKALISDFLPNLRAHNFIKKVKEPDLRKVIYLLRTELQLDLN